MSEEQLITPDERVLRGHLARGPFQSGVDRGWWRLLRIEWPHVYIAVAAAPRDRAPLEYAFRFDCQNYPQWSPTAAPWDMERNTVLVPDHWPGGTGRVAAAFNPGWNPQALYLPCDRIAIQGHDCWVRQHPYMIWTADKDITFYLRIIHDYLHSRDYSGPRRPAS